MSRPKYIDIIREQTTQIKKLTADKKILAEGDLELADEIRTLRGDNRDLWEKCIKLEKRVQELGDKEMALTQDRAKLTTLTECLKQELQTLQVARNCENIQQKELQKRMREVTISSVSVTAITAILEKMDKETAYELSGAYE